ncbi:MAG: DNA recombination protein RmuC [Bacteroidetes bacterium]|nr:DNA recombination protein RmuC [Bacteroidota bacterium]
MVEIILALVAGFGLGVAGHHLFNKAKLAGVFEARSDLTAQVAQTKLELATVRESFVQLREEYAALKAKREQEIIGWEEKRRALVQSQEELLKQFDSVSRKALDLNSATFLELAKTQVKQMITEVDAREEKRSLLMQNLVDPLSKTLKQVSDHVQEVEKLRINAYSGLSEQVKGLLEAQSVIRKETNNLVNALRKPTVRGRWGEIQLKRVVEMAGLLDHCDFEEQHSVSTENGKLRPDMLVHLPGGKLIVVDAKAPLSAYLEAIETNTEQEKDLLMIKHAEQIRVHVRQLSTKGYQDQFDTTPDLVILFLPGESFFYAALQHDPGLIEFGAENNVIIATPTTLIGLLRAVAYGWRQEQIAENAQKISRLGSELFDRLCTMADHLNKVGRDLGGAVTSYNKAVASMESRVLVSARKFKEMGSNSSGDLDELLPIETIPKQLSAPETRTT